jgi:phage terminase small subunit
LKLVNGTIKPGRDKPELELPPLEGIPEAPAFLDIEGAREFERCARLLYGPGVLTEADLALLTAYAAVWSSLVKQWANAIRPQAAELTAFRQLAGELGMTPRSRASLPPAPKASRTNLFEGIGKRPPSTTTKDKTK